MRFNAGTEEGRGNKRPKIATCKAKMQPSKEASYRQPDLKASPVELQKKNYWLNYSVCSTLCWKHSEANTNLIDKMILKY